MPTVNILCSPEAIEGTLKRLMEHHLFGFTSEDIKDALETAALILGASTARCYIHNSNYPEEVGDNFTLSYILPDDTSHQLHLASGKYDESYLSRSAL